MKQRDLVFEALLDGCANVVLCIFHVLLTCGECGFNSLVSWSYSKEWVSKLGKRYVALLEGSEISAEWRSRNLILGMNFYKIPSIMWTIR